MKAATLAAWLEIPVRDLSRFLRIAISFVSVHASLLLVYLLSTSLFLRHCGSSWLPHCFFAGFLAAAALTTALRRAPRREPFRQFRNSSAVVVLFLIVMGVTGRTSGFGVHFFALMVATVLPSLALMMFWNTVQGCLVLREVKRWTPRILAMGVLAQIACGLALGPAAAAFGTSRLYFVGAIGFVIPLIVLAPLVGRGGEGPGNAPEATETAAGAAPPVEEAPGEAGAHLLSLLARGVFIVAFSKYLLMYQLNAAVASRYTEASSMARFLGLYDALTKLLLFFTQAGILSGFLQRRTPGQILAILPVSMILTGSCVLLGDAFAGILLSNLLFNILTKGINQSSQNLVLAVFPPAESTRARLRLDGTVFSTGALAASALMMGATWLLDPSWTYALVVVLSIHHLAGCLSVDGAYLSRLQENLRQAVRSSAGAALSDLRRLAGAAAGRFDPGELAAVDPSVRLELVRDVTERGVETSRAFMEELLRRETDPKLQSVLLRALGEKGADPGVLGGYLASHEPRVRASALEAMAVTSTRRPVESAVIQALEDGHPRVRAAAIRAIAARSSEPDELRRALVGLRRMLRDESPAFRSAGCWVLGRMAHTGMVPDLVERLADPELSVRGQAVRSLARSWAPRALPALKEALKDPANEPLRPVIERAVVRLGDRTQREVLGALGGLGSQERALLARQITHLGDRFGHLVSRILRAENARFRERLVRALDEASRVGLVELLDRSLVPVGDDMKVDLGPMLEVIARGEATDVHWRLLSRLITRLNRHRLVAATREGVTRLGEAHTSGELPPAEVERLARFLALVADDPEAGAALITALTGSDRRLASVALELLEKLLPDEDLRHAVVALVERREAAGCR